MRYQFGATGADWAYRVVEVTDTDGADRYVASFVPSAVITFYSSPENGTRLTVTSDADGQHPIEVRANADGFIDTEFYGPDEVRTLYARSGAGPWIKMVPDLSPALRAEAVSREEGDKATLDAANAYTDTHAGSGGGDGAVDSVNGQTGVVRLDADDVGARSAFQAVPAADVDGLAPVATSGAYADLTSRPNLASVALSGSYGDLTGKPSVYTKTESDQRYARLGSTGMGDALYIVTDPAYGAVGDGTVDDFSAVQTCLDACHNAGGGVVLFPARRYMIQSTLSWPANSYVIMTGATFYNNTGINNPIAYNYNSSEYAVGLPLGYTGRSNITLEGGTFDARGWLATVPHNMMTFAHGRNIILRNITFRNVNGFHAFEFHSVANSTVDGCRFEGWTGKDLGASQLREAIQIDNVGLAGDDETPCNGITIRGCYFGPSPITGECGPWGRGVGSHTTSVAYSEAKCHQNLAVDGNVFDSLLEYGIKPYAWWRVIISNNHFLSTGKYAIQGDCPTKGFYGSQVQISNNTFRRCYGAINFTTASDTSGATRSWSLIAVVYSMISVTDSTAIDLATNHGTISGNRIDQPGADAIAYDGYNPNIASNSISTLTANRAAISLGGVANSNKGIIASNGVYASGSVAGIVGISIAYQTDQIITGNTLLLGTGSGAIGIETKATAVNPRIYGNVITAPTLVKLSAAAYLNLGTGYYNGSVNVGAAPALVPAGSYASEATIGANFKA